MRRSSRRDHAFPEAEMNLTPLIDVVFVVLIIFIIIAPMLELDRVELANAAPTKQGNTAPESSSISIHVKQDNTIWYGKRLVNVEQLTQILREARKTAGNRIPQLFQDKRAAFGTYQTVKNAVEVAGYEQMDVILKPN
ncbi:MAG: ExbD/TolR family protein [Rhabdochlamydiaceae bacterium]